LKLSDHSPNFEKYIMINKYNNNFKIEDFNEGERSKEIEKLEMQQKMVQDVTQLAAISS